MIDCGPGMKKGRPGEVGLLGIPIREDGVAVGEHLLVTRDDPKLRGFTHRFLGAELIRHVKTQVGHATYAFTGRG